MGNEVLLREEFEKFEKTLWEDVFEIKNNQERLISVMVNIESLVVKMENLKEHHELCRVANEKMHDSLIFSIKNLEKDLNHKPTKEAFYELNQNVLELERLKIAKKDLVMYITISSLSLGAVFTILNFILKLVGH